RGLNGYVLLKRYTSWGAGDKPGFRKPRSGARKAAAYGSRKLPPDHAPSRYHWPASCGVGHPSRGNDLESLRRGFGVHEKAVRARVEPSPHRDATAPPAMP